MEHVRQIAVRRVVIVVDVAAQADDVEQHVVQMSQLGLNAVGPDATTHHVREVVDDGLRLAEVGGRPIVLGDGKRRAEQAARRFDVRQAARQTRRRPALGNRREGGAASS